MIQTLLDFLRRHAGKLVLLVLLAAVAALVYVRTHEAAADSPGSRGGMGMGGGGGGGGGKPQPVAVAEIRRADMPIWVSALGTATPPNLVTVKSRVDGELQKLHFKEGQRVEQGQPLADIDPRPLQAQLLQAEGQLAKDEAQLANARIDLKRYQDLWQQDSIARQQVDTQAALVRQFEGAVMASRGLADTARLQLSYARISAPVGGRGCARWMRATWCMHPTPTASW